VNLVSDSVAGTAGVLEAVICAGGMKSQRLHRDLSIEVTVSNARP